MGVTRRTDSNAMFLSVKDWNLWQEFKAKRENCDTITVTNRDDNTVIEKYGLKYDAVVGRAVKLEEYKREWKGKPFTGFKLHLRDDAELFILDMPYQSRILRNFLKTCPHFNWDKPLTIRAFKGKDDTGAPEQAIWFQQEGQTVKFYFTKDNPRGMPEPKQNHRTQKWDFSEQQEWLIERMMNDTAPAIAAAAAKFAPPVAAHAEADSEPDPDHEGEPFAPADGELPASNIPAFRRPPPGSTAPPPPAFLPVDPPELKAFIQRANLNAENREKIEAELCDQLRALHIDTQKGSALVRVCWAEAVNTAKDDDDILRRLYAIVQREKAKP